MKIDPSDPSGRLGVPPDKLALMATPLRHTVPETGEARQAVLLTIIPPVELRDAPREAIEAFVAARKAGLLRGIVDEIYRSYTSDPVDATAARNLSDMFSRHADAVSRDAGGRR